MKTAEISFSYKTEYGWYESIIYNITDVPVPTEKYTWITDASTLHYYKLRPFRWAP